jgi:TetR/AcrR family transcriptional regulator, repressor for divergent bdcA
LNTKIRRPRGRPRRFDPEQAVPLAQQLFHARGYDVVGVADLTDAFGINPPSFYAAFGSKAGLFARVLDHYTSTEGVPLGEILWLGRPVSEALTAVLEEAARRYSVNPDAPGCLAIEGARCNDPDARTAARVLTAAAQDTIRRFISVTHPEAAERLADYTVTVMTGLSTMAREGHSPDRLRNTALLAAAAFQEFGTAAKKT